MILLQDPNGANPRATRDDREQEYTRDGKRPRTASPSFIAAAPTASADGRKNPPALTPASRERDHFSVGTEIQPQEGSPLFRPRARGGPSTPLTSTYTNCMRTATTAAESEKINRPSRSHSAVAMNKQAGNTLADDDMHGEAEAMAADEARYSPPSVGYSETKSCAWSRNTNMAASKETSHAITSKTRITSDASPISSAPAFEPCAQRNSQSWPSQSKNIGNDSGLRRSNGGGDYRMRSKNDGANDGALKALPHQEGLRFGVSALEYSNEHSSVEAKKRMIPKNGTTDGSHQEMIGRPREEGMASAAWGDEARPRSPAAARTSLLSAMNKSGDTYQTVRQDLMSYMESVRSR